MKIFNTLWKARSCRIAFGAALALLAIPQASTAQKPQSLAQQTVRPQSERGRDALAFLAKLDGARPTEVRNAHQMLDPDVRRSYTLSRLMTVARGRRYAGINRLIVQERTLTRQEAAAYPDARSSVKRPYVVCIAEVPKSGYGSVTYVSVTSVLRIYPSRSSWMIIDFRIASEKHPLCR